MRCVANSITPRDTNVSKHDSSALHRKSLSVMAEIERRTFDSAQSAFESLNADSVPFAPLAKQKLMQLGTALSTLDPWTRPGGFFRPTAGNGVHALMSELLLNGNVAKLSSKSWKCVKVKGSDDVCFYSDSYHLELDKAKALASVCSNVGLDVRIFEWDYPELQSGFAGYTPPKTAKVIGGGYKHLYRGKLVGFVVGAYNNPHETSRQVKKRQRAENDLHATAISIAEKEDESDGSPDLDDIDEPSHPQYHNPFHLDATTSMGYPVMGDSERCKTCGQWQDYVCDDFFMCMSCGG